MQSGNAISQTFFVLNIINPKFNNTKKQFIKLSDLEFLVNKLIIITSFLGKD